MIHRAELQQGIVCAKHQSRNRSLDGLRGLAVGLVMLHHSFLLGSGWIGVDLFFVLSGYLITTILRSSVDDANYWSAFWIKRATRILPPFLVFIAAVVIAYRLPLHWAALYLLSFGDLMAFWHARPEAPHVLWSLAVEEHFYMVWPFAVRWLKRESLIRCLIALLILEPLLRLGVCLWLHPDGNLLYYLTFFRLDSIGLGCLLAILVERPENTELLRRWSVAGFALVAVIYFAVHRALGAAFLRESNTPVYNTLIYSLIGLCCFWLLAHLITRPKGLAARLLAWSPLVWVGTISYGVYLYHLPILGGLMAAFQWTPRHAALPAAVIALLVAWISFKAMEQPAIAWGRRRAGQKEGDLARPPAGSHGRLQSE